MSDITLNTQSITGNHNFVPPGTGWNLGSGSKKWNGGYFGTIIADAGIPAGTAATGGDKIGQIRFSINPNIEPGYLALNGQEVNREDFPNLWEWVQQQVGFLVEEGEWQSISSAHNGNVGKYSVGNGSTTFRLPNLGCGVRGGGEAGTATGVGGNLDAGLPNIEGQSPRYVSTNTQMTEGEGALSSGQDYSTHNLEAGTSGATEVLASINLDASRSNTIYGNADTVQPESIIGIWLVKAYHVPVDNMGNTITVNGVEPDETGNISIEVPQPTIATQEETEAGTDNTKVMTPLRVAQSIEAHKATSIGGASVTKPAVIVETKMSGANWYRRWSDGWLEQGGVVNMPISSATGQKTVTLLKAYKNTNYVLTALPDLTNSDSAYAHIELDVTYVNKTTTKFTLQGALYDYSSTADVNWYACGQGA